jgi:very-short-patch-repair endonuclease
MPSRPAHRRALVAREAEAYGGVVARRMLRALGVDRHAVAREVAGDRWRVHGHQTVAVHCQPLGAPALWWRAVWETGHRITALDGVSALLAAGVTGYEESLVHVSVPDACTPERPAGVRVHRVDRVPGEVITTRGVPRVAPALAAVRAAHWATSDRQAALLLALPVQQGVVSPAQLRRAATLVVGRRRRALVLTLVADVADGARSLGELDFAAMCRRRQLPTPDRQVLRRRCSGRIYLDVGWSEARLALEIDGSQHYSGLSVMRDNLRQNDVTIAGDRVLRIDLLGLRLSEDELMDQVARGLGLGRIRATG